MRRLSLFLAGLMLGFAVTIGQNVPIYHSQRVESSSRYQSGNAFQKDLLLYVDMLLTTHPHYADFKRQKALKRREQSLYKWCGKMVDTTQFKACLAGLASSLNDGHTSVSWLSSFESVFPIMFSIDTDSPAIVDICTEEHKWLLGRQIAKINGRSITQIINRAQSLISADNDAYFNKSVREYLVFPQFWSLLGMSDKVMELTLVGGAKVAIVATDRNYLLKNMVQRQADADNRVTSKRDALFDYTIYEDKGICYLQFNQFADRLTQPNYPQLARFDEFICEMMEQIDKKSIQTLVVDLQYNGGGNSTLGDVLLSWLHPHRDTKRYGVDIRLSELLYLFYPYYKNFTIDNQPISVGEVYDMYRFDQNRELKVDYNAPQDSSRHIFNYDDEKIFKGNVVFVQGKDSFSSATMLLTLARDNGIGVIVGEPSGGKPSHYGDVLYCTLPNTKSLVTVSHKHFVRPNRAIGDLAYVIPDVSIKLNDPDKDLVWDWIVENYDINRLK